MRWEARIRGSPALRGLPSHRVSSLLFVTIGRKEIALGGDIILSVDGIPVVSEENIERIRHTLADAPTILPERGSPLRARISAVAAR